MEPLKFAIADSPKISEVIDPLNPFISIEFFPPKTELGVDSLFAVLKKLNPYNPLFVDFTWGAGGSTSDLTLELCVKAKERYGANPNMHLTCTNVNKEQIEKALEGCKKAGITNVLALRGDPPVGQEKWTATDGGFACARDLVEFIRREHGDYFHLTVAGYPEGHPTKMTLVEGGLGSLSPTEILRYSIEVDEDGNTQIFVCRDDDYERELQYLKSKIDAGAQCIITQMFFDTEVFGHFVTSCRRLGINVPIIPGLMCVSNYGGFKRMTKFCKTRVTLELAARMDKLKDDEEAFKRFGIDLGIEMSKRLIELGAPGLHYYTLNTSFTTLEILSGLEKKPSTIAQNRALPGDYRVADISLADFGRKEIDLAEHEVYFNLSHCSLDV